MLDPCSMPSLFEETTSSSEESSLTLSDPPVTCRGGQPSPLAERNRSQGRTSSGGIMSCGTVNELVGSAGTFRKNPIINCRQNVAIATQVISPSAIGGSLHRRRLVRHFGPVEEEDEEDDELFTRKRRMNWRRFCCYTLGIVATLLLMTGVVLSVGYLQSEKQRILTRSPKLGHLNFNSDHTETRSLGPEINIPILPTDSSQELGTDAEYFDLESDTEYPIRGLLESSTDDVDVPENSTDTIMVEDESSKVIFDLGNNELEDNSSPKSSAVSESPESDNENTPILHFPSEVKVLPPEDYRFQSVSFEIPIYNMTNGHDENTRKLTLSVRNKLDELGGMISAKTKASAMIAVPKVTVTEISIANDSTPENSDDPPPVVAKLQTDLFDGDSGETRNDPPPKVTVPNRGYTPRPGSKIMYRERPPKPKPHQLIKFARRKPGFHRFSSSTESPMNTDINRDHESDHFQPSQLDKTEHEFTTKAPPSAPLPSTEATIDVTTETIAHYDFTQGTNEFEYNTQKSSAALSNFDFQSLMKTTGEAPAINFDFSQYTTPSPIQNFDFSQFTTQAPTNAYAHFLEPQNYQAPSNYNYQPQGSYNFHTLQAPPTVNPYTHFLNSQTVASVMGYPSPLGANLNFNLDTSGSHHYGGDSGGLPSSVIPLDLARSYIQAGNPAPLQTSTSDYSAAAFSHNNPVYQANSGNGGTNNYNTITQGIHLLSLLSGNIPAHLMGQNYGQGADQFSSGNTQQFQHVSSPDYNDDGISSSTSTFLSNFNLGAFGSATVPSYTPYLPQTYNFQQNSAMSADMSPAKMSELEQQSDQIGSFSQTIISKLSKGKDVPVNSVIADSDSEQAEEFDVLGLRNLINSDTPLPTPNFLRNEISSRRPPVKKDSPYDFNMKKSQDIIRPVFSIASPITGKKLIFKVKNAREKNVPGHESGKLEIKSGFYT